MSFKYPNSPKRKSRFTLQTSKFSFGKQISRDYIINGTILGHSFTEQLEKSDEPNTSIRIENPIKPQPDSLRIFKSDLQNHPKQVNDFINSYTGNQELTNKIIETISKDFNKVKPLRE